MQLVIILFLNFAMIASAEEAPRRNRIEELFIWKISDELKLTPAEEKKISEIIKSTNQQKLELTKDLDAYIEQIAKASTDQRRVQLIAQYRKALEALGRLPIKELDQVQKGLGHVRLARYITIKAELTNKVKSLLSEKVEKKDFGKDSLPLPKVIEE